MQPIKFLKRTSRHPIFFLLLPPLFVLCSCRGGTNKGIDIFSSDYVEEEAFMTAIQKKVQPVDTTDSAFNQKLLTDLDMNVRYTYQLAQYHPLWFDAEGMKEAAKDMPAQVYALAEEGITNNYDLTYLEKIVQWSAGKDIPTDSIVLWDIVFTRSYLSIAKDLLLGDGLQMGKDPQWFAANDSLFDGPGYLARSLKDSRQLPSLDNFRPVQKAYSQMLKTTQAWTSLSKDSTYNALKQLFARDNDIATALQIIKKEMPGIKPVTDDSTSEEQGIIKSYQYYHQLRQTGSLDSNTVIKLNLSPRDYISKLQLNMLRLRRLPRAIGGEYVWVTIPLMELDYVKDSNRKFHAKVVVGKTVRQTPSIFAKMTNVVFNPPWGVPPTILKNDVGPGVSRSGSGYLARKGLRAYDAKGRDVTASVNGTNYRRFSYRQPPGAHNSLGEVKFNLPNKWDIYIHDTPHKENFSSRMRALSSGCVRVQHPKDFAAAILDDRNYTMGKIDSTIQTRRTKLEQLNRDVEVYIVYLTVAPDSTGTQLMYLQDIYKRDSEFAAEKLAALK